MPAPTEAKHIPAPAPPLMVRQPALAQEIQQGRHRGHGTVAEPRDRHRHEGWPQVLDPVEPTQPLEDRLVHLRVGLVDEDLVDVLQDQAPLVETGLDDPGDRLEGVLVHGAAVHLQVSRLVIVVGLVRPAHVQQTRMLHGVGPRRMAEHADRFLARDRLEERRARAVRVDHAVAIVGVADPRESIDADDERPPGVARPQVVIGLDHALQPAGAPEDDIVGDRLRIADAELLLHPRGERRHHVGAASGGLHVAEVVGEDDVVEGLRIDLRTVQRVLRGEVSDVGSHLARRRVPSFTDVRDRFEERDDLLVGLLEALALGIAELVTQETRVGHGVGRHVAAGADDDGMTGVGHRSPPEPISPSVTKAGA